MGVAFAVSNPKVDTTPLPDDHSVSLLHEARDYYVGSEPPFVSRNTGKNANGTIKRVVLATTDSKYPQLPVTVECTHRLWSKNYTYATVDLNGKRRIIKSRSGGPNGGASYILWRGVERGFAERPIGFTEKDLTLRSSTPTPTHFSDEPRGSPPRKKIYRASKPIVARDYHDDSITSSAFGGTPDTGSQQPHFTIPTSSSEASSEDEDGNESDSAMKIDGRSTTVATNWSFPETSEPTKSSAYIPATPISPTRMGPERSRKHSKAKNSMANEHLLDLVKRGFTIPAIREEWKKKTGYETTESSWRSRFWRLNAKGLTGGIVPYGNSGREIRSTHDTGIFDPARGIRFCAVNSRHTPGTSPYFKQASCTPEAPQPSSKASVPNSARQASELSTRQTIESPALADAGAGAHSSSTIYSHLMTPLATPIEAPTSKPTELPPAEPFALASHKLARTTLRIADPTSNTYTPLKLRSCATMSALFDKVLDICGLTTQKEGVEALKLTFEWLDEADEERNMLLKDRYEDSFEFMLEMVDEAPCWGEAGKCTVGVEVVMKEGMEMVVGRKGSKGSVGSRKGSQVVFAEEAMLVEMQGANGSQGGGGSRKTSTSSSKEQGDRKLSSCSAGQWDPKANSVADVTLEEMEG